MVAGDSGLLLATPVDKRNPSILIHWGDMYVNYNDCSNLKQIPSQTAKLVAAGWIAVE